MSNSTLDVDHTLSMVTWKPPIQRKSYNPTERKLKKLNQRPTWLKCAKNSCNLIEVEDSKEMELKDEKSSPLIKIYTRDE